MALFFVPLFALANPFSPGGLFSDFGTKADAAGVAVENSQRMALLSPAANPDPNSLQTPADLAIVDGSALEAQVGPAGSAADVAEMPQSSQISVYTVRAGDTLSQIAQMFGVSVNTLIWANDIRNHTIHEGDQLIILPVTGIRHTVLAGDTLASLAKKYGGSAAEIAMFNGLGSGAALAAGDTVIIPNGEMAPASVSHSGTVQPSGGKGKIAKSHKAAIARAARNEPYLGGSGSATGNFSWPVDGGEITQGLHGWNAVDIGAPRGTNIFASVAGTVIVAREGGWNGGYGKYVVVSHQDGTQTLYSHMSSVLVRPGESVSQGQTIGLVGTTGEATGPHLHFEVRGAQNPFAELSLGSSQ